MPNPDIPKTGCLFGNAGNGEERIWTAIRLRSVVDIDDKTLGPPMRSYWVSIGVA